MKKVIALAIVAVMLVASVAAIHNEADTTKVWTTQVCSFDTILKNGAQATEIQPVDGNAVGIINGLEGGLVVDSTWETLGVRGWCGFTAEIVKVGYKLNEGEAVYDDSFKQTTEDAVVNAAAAGGATSATRFAVLVPVAGVTDATLVTIVAELGDGSVADIIEFSINGQYTAAAEEEPVVVENLVIDFASFTEDDKFGGDSVFKASWPEAGFDAALFVQGYDGGIKLGDIDLSKYSAVKITYAFDGSAVTAPRFDAAKDVAYIGLKSTETSFGEMGQADLDGAIAYGTMEFSEGGWGARRTCEIDLSDVDYNGPVIVTAHNPEGTQIAISAIEFVAAEGGAPETADAAIVVVAAVAAIALAGVVVCKKANA